MEKSYSLNNKKFKSIANSENGEVSSDTIFSYYEANNIIWGNYHGGRILKGQLLGKRIDQKNIKFSYQHINESQDILTGQCQTRLEINATGKLILNEHWKWTCGDLSTGTSTLIEI